MLIMSRLLDVRNQMPGGNTKRNINQIKKIARHHSGTPTGSAEAFARYHTQTLGWSTSGYHEVILPDGRVQLCYSPNVVTNGVRGHNDTTYHICLVGNGNFTAAQEEAFKERAEVAMQLFNLKVTDVLGHREFSGANTQCPGIDMNVVRRNLQNHIDSKKVIKDSVNTHTVRSGETLSQIASRYNTTVKAIADLNNIRNVNLIRTGQVLQLPDAEQPALAAKPKYSRLLRNTRPMMRGEDVRSVQSKLGIKADGIFGPQTERVVREYQRKNKLTVDGIVGPQTWNHMFK